MYEFLTGERQDRDWDAIVYFNKRLNYGRFIDGIDNLAFFLHKKNIGKGDNVAICLPNIPHAAVAFYAVNKCGAVGNVIHPMISEYGLLNIIKNTRPKIIFLADIFYEKYKAVLSDIDITVIICPMGYYASAIIRIGIKYKSAKEKVPVIIYSDKVIRFAKTLRKKGEVKISTGGRDIAAYLHSGGTTGEAKTIVLTNYAINAVAINALQTFDTRIDNDVAFMVLPLFHGYGLGINMHAFLSFGCRLVMVPKFTAKSAVKIIKKEGVTIMTGVPSMYEKLYNSKAFRRVNCKNFHLLICGGDNLSAALRENFDKQIQSRGAKVRLVEGYGLTEVVAVAAVNTDKHYSVGSVGKAIKGVQIKIIDENLAERPCGEYGEILIASQSLMEGYYKDERTTKEAVITDENGKRWLKTGDCGYMDEDGYVFFKDRIKRLIIISGVNVFPSEIEDVVSLMPEIKMCCAVEGRSKENKIIIKLFVVLNDEYKYNLTLENKIIQTCKDNLIKFAIPGKVISKPSLPVTQVGKVNYRMVMTMDDQE
ncbi:MAG: acyl--CoA ligase [Clostridiales bacterium]|nr:acyl--CoA ligase [Clostridiales bacterium]